MCRQIPMFQSLLSPPREGKPSGVHVRGLNQDDIPPSQRLVCFLYRIGLIYPTGMPGRFPHATTLCCHDPLTDSFAGASLSLARQKLVSLKLVLGASRSESDLVYVGSTWSENIGPDEEYRARNTPLTLTTCGREL